MALILLIEDNPGDVLLTREAFKECGREHRIISAKDGIEALEYLVNEDSEIPDLILLDLNLPRKDGREVLREIKTSENLHNIPVIVLSTSRNENDIHECYKLNANCYVSKPLELDNFMKSINTIEKFWMQTATFAKTIKQLA